MPRRVAVVLIVSLVAVPALAVAQTSLLPTLQRIRPEYPTPWASLEQVGEFLNRVAWEHRAEGWGLLKKASGTRCPAPQGVEISCDILIHQPTQLHFDVLVDSTVQGIPAWQDRGLCDPSTSGCAMDRFLLPIAVLSQPRNLRVIP